MVNKAHFKGFTPLFVASQRGHTEIVKALLENDDIDVNKASSDGATPLLIASQNGHTEIVDALLKNTA